MPERFPEFVGLLHRNGARESQEEQEEAGLKAPPPICGYFRVVMMLSAQNAEQTVFVDARVDAEPDTEIGAEIETESGDIRAHGHTRLNVGRHIAEEPAYEPTDVTKQSIHQSQHAVSPYGLTCPTDRGAGCCLI